MSARLAKLEAQEASARRSDPGAGDILAAAQRAYLELAEEMLREQALELRVALLADVIRLARHEGFGDVEAESAVVPHAHEIVEWTNGLSLSDPESRWIRWLAHDNVVSLLEAARLKIAIAPAQDTNLAAMRMPVAAAREVEAIAPRLLGLHQLAAALWERKELDELERIVEELDPIEPVAHRKWTNRAHVAIARGRYDDAVRFLEAALAASPPTHLASYLRQLTGALAVARGDLASARKDFARIRAGAPRWSFWATALERLEADPSTFPPIIELVAWEQPAFVYAEEPYHELAIELWKRLPRGRDHARFVAGRLALFDPHAQWRKKQEIELGAPFPRTHEALIAELLANTERRVTHPLFGQGVVVRELEGGRKLEIEFASAGRKVMLASSVG